MTEQEAAEIRQNLATKLRDALKLAWGDICHYLILSDPENASEAVTAYKGILDWHESGQITTTPFFNWSLGHVVGQGVLPASIHELGVKEMQDMFVSEGYYAVEELLEEVEQVVKVRG